MMDCRSSLLAVKIDFRDLKCERSFLAVAGPMFGKPSKINCCCSALDLNILEGRIETYF